MILGPFRHRRKVVERGLRGVGPAVADAPRRKADGRQQGEGEAEDDEPQRGDRFVRARIVGEAIDEPADGDRDEGVHDRRVQEEE